MFRSYREGTDFQTIVSIAREAELLQRDDFGGPKRVRTGGQFSGTSSGGRGSYRGGGSFQRQSPVHAALPAIESGPAARGSSSSGRGGYSITPISSHTGYTPRSCYSCGDPGHLIRQCPHRTVSAVPEIDSAPLLEVGVVDRHRVEADELQVEVLVVPPVLRVGAGVPSVILFQGGLRWRLLMK